MNYSIHLIDTTDTYFDEIQNLIAPEKLNWFNGNGYESFSKLINECVSNADTELVIILSYKARPTSEQIQEMVALLESGYAFVSKHDFRCFGLHKELLRKIGMMDERFNPSGFEDYDLIARTLKNNLAIHATLDVHCITAPSRWSLSGTDSYGGYDFWKQKWWHPNNDVKIIIQMIRDLPNTYNLGPSTGFVFKDRSQTVCYSWMFDLFTEMTYFDANGSKT